MIPNLVNRLTEHDVRISAQPLDESMPSLLGVLVPGSRCCC